jgi:hypothetical protein
VRVRRPTAVGGDNSVSAVNFTVTRAAAPDGNITVNYTDGNGTSMNSTGIYNSANGNLTAAISNGNSNTQYRMLITSGSASPSGTVNNNIFFGQRTGNGNITIVVNNTQASTIQGDQASYRVEYREVGTSTWFNATGTRATFTLTHSVESPNTPIVIQNGAQSPTASITVQEAFSNAPPTDCVVEFNQAGGGFTTATGSPRTVTGYSQSRGTTVAYSARFRNATTGQVSLFGATVNNYFLTYLTGFDSSIVIGSYTSSLNSTLSGATGDVTIPYSGGSSITEYRIESSSVSGTIDTDSGSSGSFLLDYSNNELPPDGASYTYFFQGRRSAATGGDPNGSFGSVTTTPSTISVSRANLTASDLAITVNGNSPASPTTTSAFTESLNPNTAFNNAETSNTIAIAGAQIGDQVRVIKAPSGPLLLDFVNITSTSFNLVVPTSLTNFPPGTSNDAKVQIRRPNANNGNNVNATALTYTYQRALNQAQGRVLSSSGGDFNFGQTTTIGATAYTDANGSTPTDIFMDLAAQGSVSGQLYRLVVTSGTTEGGTTAGGAFTPVTAGGASYTNSLGESRLPNVNASVSYKVQTQDASATGDQVWYDCYRTIGGVFAGTQYLAVFTVTRSNYVQPDTAITTSNSFTATGSQPPYIISEGSTSETVSWTGASVGTEYFMQTGDPNGTFPDLGTLPEFGNTTGSTSGSITITESSGFSGLPESSSTSFTDAYFTLYGRVPKSANGSGQRTQIEFYAVRREYIESPIISGLTVRADSGDASKIVPCAEFSNYGGSGQLQYAFSTTSANPTNWTNTGFSNLVATSRFNGPSTPRSATALYIGIRQISNIDSSTSTPVYTSNTSGPYYLLPDRSQQITSIEYPSNVTSYSAGDSITIPNSDTSNTGTIRASIPNRQVTQSEIDPLSIGSTGLGTLSSTTSYVVNTTSGTIPNGAAGALVGYLATPSNTASAFSLSNPAELPVAGNTVNYRLRSFLFTSRGGTSSGEANTANHYDPTSIANNEFDIERSSPADGVVTITVPDTQFYNQVATNQTITLNDGSSVTEYQIIVTPGSPDTPISSNPVAGPATPSTTSTTFTLNQLLDVPSASGDIVEYQVQFREAGSSAAFVDCTGTNTTFKLAALNADAIVLTDGVPPNNRATNTDYETSAITINGIASTQTFSISGTGASFKVNNGTMDASDKSVSEGDTIVVRLTTSSVANTARTATLGFPGLTPNTKTWTLTTGTSTGTGSGTGPGTGTGTYGLQINNSSGNNLIDQNSRVARFVSNGNVVVAGGGTTSSAISVTGLTNTDDWTIVVTVALTPTAAGQPSKFSVNKGTGSFTITNNTEEQEPSSNDNQRRFYWWAFKNG